MQNSAEGEQGSGVGEGALFEPLWTAEIRGMGFRPPAKAILEALKAGTKLELVQEPTNKFDPYALQVWVEPSAVSADCREELELKLAGYGRTLEEFDEAPQWMLGYVGKEWARQIAEHLSARQPWPALRAELAFSGEGKPQARIGVED